MNRDLNAFCGTCGAATQEAAAAPSAADASPHGRYRGPRRMLTAGAGALIIGVTTAIASFSIVQGKGVSGFALDIAVPAINIGLGIAGLGQIPETAGGEEASMIIVVMFIAGVMLAMLGACLFLWGAIWMLVRYAPRNRGEKLYTSAQPVVSELAHKSGRQIDAALEHSQQKLTRVRPKVERAAGRGRETISASTERGRRQWFKAAPTIRGIATYGRRRMGHIATGRKTISAEAAPTSPGVPVPSEHSPASVPTYRNSEAATPDRD